MNALSSIRDELSRFHGIDMTPEQVNQLFADAHDLLAYIQDNDMDTGGREGACSVLALKLVGQDWPCGDAGPEAGATFLRDLKVALTARGIAHRIK